MYTRNIWHMRPGQPSIRFGFLLNWRQKGVVFSLFFLLMRVLAEKQSQNIASGNWLVSSHWNNSRFGTICCHTQALDRVSEFCSIREAIVTGRGARSVQDLQTQFMGELQVRLILTGLGGINIADLAKSPPIWATGGSRSVFFCVATSCKLQWSIWERLWSLQTSCVTQHWRYVSAQLLLWTLWFALVLVFKGYIHQCIDRV